MVIEVNDNFYVYIYKDIDGTPVYVGKGTGNRAWEHKKGGSNASNDRLKRLLDARINAGFDIEPSIVAKGYEDDMFMIEAALIQFFGREDLATGTLFNFTDGGEGVSNPNEEIRKKMSKASFEAYGEERIFTFVNAKTSEEFTGNCPNFARHIGVRLSTVNRLVLEQTDLHSTHGWTVKDSGFIANEYNTKFNFVHAFTGEKIAGTQAQLMQSQNLSASLISQMVKGKIKHANGWCLEGNEKLLKSLKKNSNGNYYTPSRPWENPNATTKSLVTWALADKIIETYNTLKKDHGPIGEKLVRRSMHLYDELSLRATDTIIKIAESENFDPAEDSDWVEFQSYFASQHSLPKSKFDGRLIDGRSNKK